MCKFVLILVAVVSACMIVMCGNAHAAEQESGSQSAVSTFTLLDVRGTVSPDALLVRVNGIGTVRRAGSPVGFTWFAQMGTTSSIADDGGVTLAPWAALQLGMNIAFTTRDGVVVSNDLRAGARLTTGGAWSFNPEHNFVLRKDRTAVVIITTPLFTSTAVTFVQEGWVELALVRGHVGIGPHYFVVVTKSDGVTTPNPRAGMRATFGGPSGQVYVMIDVTAAESPAVVPSLGTRFFF